MRRPRQGSTSRYKVLNSRTTPPPATDTGGAAGKFANPGIQPPATSRTAKYTPPAPPVKKPKTAATPSQQPKKCRVWTASYGGQKAIIIRSTADRFVNYTVLDVNAGREEREARAYIAAYAKGGRKIGEFKKQSDALNKAFKLCPDG